MDAFEINFSCPHGLPERKVRTRAARCLGCCMPICASLWEGFPILLENLWPLSVHHTVRHHPLAWQLQRVQ